MLLLHAAECTLLMTYFARALNSAAYLLAMPVFAEVLRRTLLEPLPTHQALQLLGAAFAVAAVSGVVVFIAWAAQAIIILTTPPHLTPSSDHTTYHPTPPS